MSKSLLNGKLYFIYCSIMYGLFAVVLASATSVVFTMLLSESLAPVFLAYWIAKMVTRFVAIRTYYTPLVFIIVQVIAMFCGVTFSHESSGTPFTMWTCGCATVLFSITQLVIKKISAMKTAVN